MRSPRTATKSSPRSPQLEKAQGSNENPAQPKINKFIKKRKDGVKNPEGGALMPCFLMAIVYPTERNYLALPNRRGDSFTIPKEEFLLA